MKLSAKRKFSTNAPALSTVASISILLSAVALSGCGSSSSSSDPEPSTPSPIVSSVGTADYVADNKELKGDFDEDVTLVAGQIYRIDGE
ncbi:MAG: hypothetical protein ACJASG_000106, partial [Oleiphilaceae bacterium]